MITPFKHKVIAYFTSDDTRTRRAKKNILLSFTARGISIILNIILVPLTISYINPEKYGIWLTISSIIVWFNYFDFGLGNGLRNQLAMAVSSNNLVKIKQLIATAYASLTFISLLICAVFIGVNQFAHWDSLLNVSVAYREELKHLIDVLLIMFCLQFILQVINVINYAYQRSAYVSFNLLLGNLLSTLFVVLLKHFLPGNLIYLGIAFFLGNLLSSLIFTIALFAFQKKELFPRFSQDVSFQRTKTLLNLGAKFFIIQIAGLIQYESVNILISRNFHPLSVTEYNVAYKLFNIVMMIFGVIMAPIWSAVTEANVKEDYLWIKATEKRLLKIWACFSLFSIFLLVASPYLYHIWLKGSVKVSVSTSIGVMLYVISMTFGMIYVHILNGLGKLKTQLYISLFTMVYFIPLTYYLAVVLRLGIFGISLGLICANVNGLLAAPFEFNKYINAKLRMT